MNQVEVRKKLRQVIREIALDSLENDREIPPEICKYILTDYGWTVDDNCQTSLDDFTEALQKFIQDSIPTPVPITKKESIATCDEVFQEYLQAETEYCQVTSELVKILEEAVQYKETYAQDFKQQCKALEDGIEVPNMKTLLTKLQFLLKLYSEENALDAHLQLQSILTKELEIAKRTYEEVIELNKQYDEMKNDKTFCELFRNFKELKKIEKRIEIIDTIK